MAGICDTMMLRAAAIIATAVTFLTILPAEGFVLKATAKNNRVLRAHDGGVTESRSDLVGRGDAVRQTFLGAALFGAALYAPSKANAGWFGGSAGDDVSTALDEVAKTRVKVEEILNGLKKKELKGGRDDSATVVRYSDAFYKPLQAKLVDLAPKLQLADGEQQKRAELLPLLLKGHLFELSAATKSGNPAEQLEEMEEVAETVDEFLTLAKTKYSVKDYVSQKAEQWDVVKEYGPFACEFWGKQRLPDSNVCVPKEG